MSKLEHYTALSAERGTGQLFRRQAAKLEIGSGVRLAMRPGYGYRCIESSGPVDHEWTEAKYLDVSAGWWKVGFSVQPGWTDQQILGEMSKAELDYVNLFKGEVPSGDPGTLLTWHSGNWRVYFDEQFWFSRLILACREYRARPHNPFRP